MEAQGRKPRKKEKIFGKLMDKNVLVLAKRTHPQKPFNSTTGKS